MRDSKKLLFKAAVEQAMKIGAFVILAIIVVCILPSDTPRRIGRWWEQTKQNFRERHQPFYEFLVGKDMERAKKQWGQFKGD